MQEELVQLGLYSGLYSHDLYGYGLCYGLYSHVLCSYGICSYGTY